jgi:3-hydroxyisobutyrate dehydrogenase
MGSRMAVNLQKHGYPLVVFNRTRAKAEPLLGPCGTFSDSPAKLAEQVDCLIHDAGPSGRGRTSSSGRQWIFESPPVKCTLDRLWFGESVVLEEDGRRSSAPRGSFRRRARDQFRSACRRSEAHFVGGADIADLERIRSLLLCMGNKIVHTGGHGTGSA